MGRLQRKKPVVKKKKQKQEGADSQVAVNDADEKVVSLTDFSKNKQKQQPPPQKKLSAPAIPMPAFWEKGMQFLREVRIELKKVTWPSRTQTIGSTAVVIILVMIISFFLGLVDMGLSGLVQLILH